MRISDWSSDVCSSDLFSKYEVGGSSLGDDSAGEQCFKILHMGVMRHHPPVDGDRLPIDVARLIRSQEGDQRGDVLWPAKLTNWRVLQNGRASCRERVCQYV